MMPQRFKHCDRCGKPTQGWENDMCLRCRIDLGYADASELEGDDVKAVIYTRTGSYTLPGEAMVKQLQACQRVADKRGWQVVGQFADVGVPGGPDMRKLVKAVEAGEVDAVITFDAARLSRTTAMPPIIGACRARGVPIVFADNTELPAETDQAELIGRIVASVTEKDERRIRRLRSERSRSRRCRCGYEARDGQDLDEHVLEMTSSLLVNDPNPHGEA